MTEIKDMARRLGLLSFHIKLLLGIPMEDFTEAFIACMSQEIIKDGELNKRASKECLRLCRDLDDLLEVYKYIHPEMLLEFAKLWENFCFTKINQVATLDEASSLYEKISTLKDTCNAPVKKEILDIWEQLSKKEAEENGRLEELVHVFQKSPSLICEGAKIALKKIAKIYGIEPET